MNDLRPELEQALERLKINRFDKAAWATLYDQLVPRARAASYRILGGNVSHVADVVQDALERLLRYGEFGRFASAEDLIRYFSIMARNSALDSLKRSAAHSVGSDCQTTSSDGDAAVAEEVAAEGADPEEIVAAARTLAQLDNLLSPKDKVVFSLLAQGYGRNEIAARLGVTESHAAVMVHRLRVRMREMTHRI